MGHINHCILGIDPGVSGAMALLDPTDSPLGIFLYEFPTYISKSGTKRRALDHYQLSLELTDMHEFHGIRAVYIEEVHTMPRQGIASAFAFGATYGAILQACASLALPTHRVPPNVWKRAMRCPADKDAARARASAMFPHAAGAWAKKSDDGKAEAALIAAYGFHHLVSNGVPA